MLYEIEFHRVEHYYHSEYIEADSEEQATEIANNLLASRDFDEDIVLRMNYEYGENKLDHVELAANYKLTSMTADEIADYLQEG